MRLVRRVHLLIWKIRRNRSPSIGRVTGATIFAMGIAVVAHPFQSSALDFVQANWPKAAAQPSLSLETRQIGVRAYRLYPTSGPSGSEVRITGLGFTDNNSIHFGNRVIAHVGIKSVIGIACTNDPGCRAGIQQTLAFTVPDGLPGAYRVWVENTNGKSDATNFSITKS
jgi:hypothetical protein